MPLNFLFMVLRSRMALIALVMMITVAVSGYFSVTQPKRYTATASLLLNFASDNPFDNTSLPPQLASSYMATQVGIIASRKVALYVVDEQNLGTTTGEKEAWVKRLLDNLDVDPASDSRLITVSYTDRKPETAARLANSFARGYAATTQALSIEPSKRNAERFDVQIELMRSRLARAQSKLTSFQQDKGIVALDEKLDTETTRLHNLADELLEAQANTRDVRARQLGVNHPEYIRAIQSEASLTAADLEQKNRVLQLKQQRDELGVLAREVQVEQATYENALQSYYNEQMQSSFGQAGVDVLDPAVPPRVPTTPGVAVNMIGGLLLGAFLGMLLAVGTELLFRRIRSADNIEELLDTRMLNSV